MLPCSTPRPRGSPDLCSPTLVYCTRTSKDWAFESREFLRALAVGKPITFTSTHSLPPSDDVPRDIGTAEINGVDLASELLKNGWAKLKELKREPTEEDLRKRELEAEARSAGKGVWNPHGPKVRIPAKSSVGVTSRDGHGTGKPFSGPCICPYGYKRRRLAVSGCVGIASLATSLFGRSGPRKSIGPYSDVLPLALLPAPNVPVRRTLAPLMARPNARKRLLIADVSTIRNKWRVVANSRPSRPLAGPWSVGKKFMPVRDMHEHGSKTESARSELVHNGTY